jgi:hypothetical protein
VSILFPLVCLGARAARAEGTDYALDNKDWNGLSDLVSIAEGRGLTVEVRAALRWSDIGASDVLFLLYPTARVEPVHLAAFLRNGGRALIADDFGRADEALARLGILRKEMRPHPGVRLHEGNSNLPIATPVDDHPLARGVPQLNTNHPAAFQVSPGPDVIFSYQSGGGRDEAVVPARTFSGSATFKVALSLRRPAVVMCRSSPSGCTVTDFSTASPKPRDTAVTRWRPLATAVVAVNGNTTVANPLDATETLRDVAPRDANHEPAFKSTRTSPAWPR